MGNPIPERFNRRLGLLRDRQNKWLEKVLTFTDIHLQLQKAWNYKNITHWTYVWTKTKLPIDS